MGNQQSQNSHHPQPASQQHKPQFIGGRPSPKYIRSITIENRTNKNFRIVTKHKSMQSLVMDVGPGTIKAIQKTVQGNGFTSVDPIISYLFQEGGNATVFQADQSDVTKIQARYYIIQANKISRTK